MSSVKLYGYHKCNTCRKASRYLIDNNIDFNEHDLSQGAPSKSEVRNLVKGLAGQFGSLFNTSGKRYRELQLGKSIKLISAIEAIELLARDGMLVKRPLLLSREGNLIGFKEKEWATWLKRYKG